VQQPPTPQQQPVMNPGVFSPMTSPMFTPAMSPGFGSRVPTGNGFLGPTFNQAAAQQHRARRRNHSSRRFPMPREGGHGIKQDLIDVVQNACKEYFTKLNTYVCIRNETGGQTIRITLKKIESLRKIRSTVAKLNNNVEIEEFSMHVLLRNRKQHQTRRKSGLTMYVKLKNAEEAPKALEILQADAIPAALVTKSLPSDSADALSSPILTEKKSSVDSAKPKMPSLEKQLTDKVKAPVEDEDEDFEPPLPPRPPKKILPTSDEDFTPPIPLLKKRSSSFSLKLENGEVLELEVQQDQRTGAKLTANSSLDLQDALYKYVPKAPLPGSPRPNERA